MFLMLRTSLSDSQRSELQALRRTDLPAVPSDRLEMVLMSAAGWSPPKIAEHLRRHPHTVRSALKGFAARGTAAFYPDAPGPDPDHDRTATVTGKLSELLSQERTWTARQLADVLGPNIGIGHRQTRRSWPCSRPATGGPPRLSGTSKTPQRSNGNDAPSTR
jgi:transposase